MLLHCRAARATASRVESASRALVSRALVSREALGSRLGDPFLSLSNVYIFS